MSASSGGPWGPFDTVTVEEAVYRMSTASKLDQLWDR